MTYKLNPNLFIEQGAAVLARRARTSARVYRLLDQPADYSEPRPLDRAA